MRKLLVVVLLIILGSMIGCKGYTSDADIEKTLLASVKNTMAARSIEADVTVTKLDKLSDPKGFYFFKITIKDTKRGISQDQYLFFNGKYIVGDFADYKTGASMSRKLQFEHSYTEIDTKGLSLIYGSRDAKNVIVKITDFQCPFCRKANAFLEEKLKGRTDVAVYIMHFPLTAIHPKAVPFAKIFEAGNLMGQNFSHELFSNEALLDMSDDAVITYFADKSGDAARFRELVNSEQVANILSTETDMATKLGVTATPVIYINGKRIEGFDQNMMTIAIDGFKK